ncbi:MetQ/NlpA family ABC transporter substrate-binding protein [Lachnoclostridium sp. Marseille-P6806]|uniref:MetQ/NlpA family ABC transporter substrate-binding protein n=1 Tax=Lachnoclostridium sp. Marseille-P6806 TaxID=2364793 RepID=UPI00102F30E3|nr:MetQ/NlpA family ABC transporter substrate-binding protein [Lachnoclostridium sp. Marseille-P6806]
MKKKVLAGLLTAALAAGALVGCGSGAGAASQADALEAAEAQTAEDGGTEASAVPVTLKIAASPTPHAEILEKAAELLAAEGVTLEVTEFEDYVQPNEVVESGDFDANYFQHVPYLESFNEEKGTHLVVAGKIHYEPFGIYPGTKKSLSELADGDTVAVPNDTTNEARALLLLQDNGLITLTEDAGLTATVNDITENPKNLKIQEVEAAQVPHLIGEVSYAVMNGNYALAAGYTVSGDALAYESSESEAAKTYVNVIAVKEGNENNEAVKKLVEVLKSDEIRQFINDNYNGNVIPYDGE